MFKRLSQLSGWQRIWVVFSVLSLLVTGIVVSNNFLSSNELVRQTARKVGRASDAEYLIVAYKAMYHIGLPEEYNTNYDTSTAKRLLILSKNDRKLANELTQMCTDYIEVLTDYSSGDWRLLKAFREEDRFWEQEASEARRHNVRFMIGGLAVWLLVSVSVYASVSWIHRGFKKM